MIEDFVMGVTKNYQILFGCNGVPQKRFPRTKYELRSPFIFDMLIMKKSQPKNRVNMSSDFEPSALDEKFRENVRDLLEKAEKEVIIITGEGGSYQYQDLRWALERVSEKGIPIRRY